MSTGRWYLPLLPPDRGSRRPVAAIPVDPINAVCSPGPVIGEPVVVQHEWSAADS
ncbi:MAG: hypothetical protein ACLPVF_02890 [Acidimicrobiales bacterium]